MTIEHNLATVINIDFDESSAVGQGGSYRILYTIGDDTNGQSYVFDRIRAGLWLGPNRVAVADQSANQIRVFGLAGDLLHAFGGRGEGPGEFMSIKNVVKFGLDSLIVHDDHLQRISVFDTEGNLDRTWQTPWANDGQTAVEIVSVQDVLLASLRQERDPRRQVGETLRDTLHLVWLDPRGQGVRHTGFLLQDRWWAFSRETGALRARSPPDGPYALLAAMPGRLFMTSNDASAIALADLRVGDRAGPPGEEPVSPFEDGDRLWDAAAYLSQLHFVPDGGLWVSEFLPEDLGDARTTRRWARLSADGDLVRVVSLPANLTLLDASVGDSLLMFSTDTLGVQRVEIIALDP